MTEDRLHLTHANACRTAFDHAPAAAARILFCGEDNPLSLEPEHALYPLPEGCSGWRFCNKILAVRRATYLATWRTNLCVGKWNVKDARVRARELIDRTNPWNVIVILGRKTADVMANLTTTLSAPGGWLPFTERSAVNDGKNTDVPTPRLRIVYLPHPSGRNTIWNNPNMAKNARVLLRSVEPDYPWGEAL